MISQKSVQEILDVARIEDVVQDFVTLKRRGVNLIGLCPFHSEKTPSFNVSPAKNIYKCFGCGQAGDPAKFLMEHEHYTFPEALRYLARKYGIEIEETLPSPEALMEQQRADSLFILNDFAKDFFQEQLFDTDHGKSIGLSYFKKRGFREETIRKFGLGFAPDQKDALTLKAIQAGFSIDLLRQVGLTTPYDRDFFRNRVMFTIHNLSGKVIGFGGRILQKDVKAPKYINTPETEIYNKSKALYGAFFAKQAIRREDECILVEGYTDVISLHQAGIEHVVASSGTALTVDQIRLIKRYTANVRIIYDGDFAGIKAAMRGVDLLLEQDLNVRIVLLPEGEDPDSYLQHVGTALFKEYIQREAQDFIMFKAGLLLKEAGSDPVKKTQLIKDIVNSIGLIPDPIKRSLYIKECALIMGVEEQLLVNESNKVLAKQVSKKGEHATREQTELLSQHLEKPILPATPDGQATLAGDEYQEKEFIRVIIYSGGEIFDLEEKMTVAEYLISNIEDFIDHFHNEQYRQIITLVMQVVSKGEELSPQYFLRHPDAGIRELTINMLSSPYELSENWEKRYDITLQTQKMPEHNYRSDSRQALKHFRLRKIKGLCHKNAEKLRELQSAGNYEQILIYLKLQQKLNALRNELAAELGIVVF